MYIAGIVDKFIHSKISFGLKTVSRILYMILLYEGLMEGHCKTSHPCNRNYFLQSQVLFLEL